jgi:hypothetical protein
MVAQKKPMGIIGLKFSFLAAVLSDKESRNKRRPRLTAFDGAVLSVLIDRYNTERGYSFTGCRGIAEIVNATPQGVSKSIRKLKSLNVITDAGGGYRNRAQRLTPNFDAYVNGYSVATTGNGHTDDATVNGHSVDVAATAMQETDTLGTRSYTEGNGTYPGAGAKRPSRAKARRAASSPDANPDAKKIMAMLEKEGGNNG